VQTDDGWQCRNPFCRQTFDEEVECVSHELGHARESYQTYLNRGDMDAAISSDQEIERLEFTLAELTRAGRGDNNLTPEAAVSSLTES
jgi:hypothetical protein